MNHNNYLGKTLNELIKDIPEYAKGFYVIMPKDHTNLSLEELLELSTVINVNLDHYFNGIIEHISDRSIDGSYWVVIN